MVSHHSTDSCDSGFFDDDLSSTTSLPLSIYDYEECHGRTYHAHNRGKYFLPNDEKEIERMKIFHEVFRRILQRNYYSPLESPLRVLDVGTGSGCWALDVADCDPWCEVIGSDLSPIQPTLTAPNCSFDVLDVDEEWNFSQDFDLIHTRHMLNFTIKSWDLFIRRAHRHLRSGGWLEMQEVIHRRLSDDNSIPPDSPFAAWEEKWHEALKERNMEFYKPDDVVRALQEAGFVNVQCREFKIPIGEWPKDRKLKEAGSFCMVQLLEGLYGFSAKLFKDTLGYSEEALQEFLMECKNDLIRKDIHAYWGMFVIYGQKPED